MYPNVESESQISVFCKEDEWSKDREPQWLVVFVLGTCESTLADSRRPTRILLGQITYRRGDFLAAMEMVRCACWERSYMRLPASASIFKPAGN